MPENAPQTTQRVLLLRVHPSSTVLHRLMQSYVPFTYLLLNIQPCPQIDKNLKSAKFQFEACITMLEYVCIYDYYTKKWLNGAQYIPLNNSYYFNVYWINSYNQQTCWKFTGKIRGRTLDFHNHPPLRNDIWLRSFLFSNDEHLNLFFGRLYGRN